MKKLLFSISLALSLAACNNVDTITPTAQIQTIKATAATWAAGVAYKTGDVVSYLGRDYKCIQGHTSLTGWEPATTAALWQDLGTSTTSDTTAPSVSLASSSTSVTAAGSITLTATATDNVGVSKVEFYDGTNLVGTKTAAPFTLPLTASTSDNGTHNYTAVAYDAAGNKKTSSVVSVVVNISTVASVTLAASSTNVTTNSTLTLTATPVNVTPTKVEFYSGTTKIATVTAAPYTYALALTSANNGTKSFSTKVYNSTSTTTPVATSAAVSVVVKISTDTTAPTVSLASSSTSVTAAGSITLTATATDNIGVSKVEFYDGTYLVGTKTAAPYSLPLTASASDNGTHNYTAVAYDAAGNKTSSSAVSVVVNIPVDTVAPTVSLAASSTSITTSASSVTFTATAADNVGVSRVAFYDGTTLLATKTAAPYTNTILYTSADNGIHNYTAVAYDAAGNKTSSSAVSVNVNIDITTGGGSTSTLPKHALVGYWHNFENPSGKTFRLNQVSSDWDVIVVAFGDDAGNGAVKFTVDTVGGAGTEAEFIADVKEMKAKGKKVILSLGGQNGTVTLNTAANVTNFVNSLYDIIQKYGFDGIDLDLESGAGVLWGAPIINNLVSSMKQLKAKVGPSFYLSMAPEHPYVQGGFVAGSGIWGSYLPIIDGLRDDLNILHVQYYNNGGLYTPYSNSALNEGTVDGLVGGSKMLIEGFTIANNTTFKGLRPDQVAFGVPSGRSSANTGYADPSIINKALDCMTKLTNCGTVQPLQAYPTFRGVMTWSINWDKHDGFNFSKPVGSYLKLLP